MPDPTFEQSLHMIDVEYQDGHTTSFAAGYFKDSEDLNKKAQVYLDLSKRRIAFPNAKKFTVRKATEDERMKVEQHDKWLRNQAQSQEQK